MGISSSVDVEPQPKRTRAKCTRGRVACIVFASAGMRSEGGPCRLHGMHAVAAAGVAPAVHSFPCVDMCTSLLRVRGNKKEYLAIDAHATC